MASELQNKNFTIAMSFHIINCVAAARGSLTGPSSQCTKNLDLGKKIESNSGRF